MPWSDLCAGYRQRRLDALWSPCCRSKPRRSGPSRQPSCSELIAVVRPDGRTPQPIGRVLAGAPYRVREEAVPRPRVGVRVVREAERSRWILGGTHLWVARRKLAGRGEGSSGLRYDVGETSKAS